ncbi:MAG: hypothetical protein ACRDJW_11315 [Thermomicrobiales bacterium]
MQKDTVTVTLEVRISRDELAKVLYLSDFDTARPTVWQIRKAVKGKLAELGARECERRYAVAVADVEALNAAEPDELHHQMHIQHLRWCQQQIARAFRVRRREPHRESTGVPLIEIL